MIVIKNMVSILKVVLLMWPMLYIVSGNAQRTTESNQENEKPNIIFILTDDLGYGDLGVFFQNQIASGKAREFTPHLDRMAAEGALLPNHYAAAPVCAPSRASLLSGRSQGHANIRDNQFDKALADNLTLGSVLQNAGYATAAIGKWGLQGKDDRAPNWTAHPLNRGFDYYLGYIRHGDGHEHYPKEGIYGNPKEVYHNRTNIAADLDKCYTADLWTAAAKKWIVDHKKGTEAQKPFFMYLAYDTPHAVLELPTQKYPEGGGLNGGLQWIGEPGHMINTASGKVDSWMHPDYENATYDHDENPNTEQVPWADVHKRYATDARRIDNAVGDLLRLLKDLNIDENTMVVFTSDNGPSRESYLKGEPITPVFLQSFGPFDGIKRDCWEGGLRMPTIARWPKKIPNGISVGTPSISYDWMPTFIDMAGLPIPALSDGTSLVPSLLQRGKQTASNIYIEYYQNGITPAYATFVAEHQKRPRNQMQMLRFENLVGIRYDIQSQSDDFEIYDIVKDPQQAVNLAKKSDMTSLQERLKATSLRSRMPNNTAVRPYDNIAIPSIPDLEVENGVQWKAYQGNFDWVPKMETLQPMAQGTTDYPIADINTVQPINAILFEGYIEIPEDGEYTFQLTSSSKSLLRIHNATVIDAGYDYFANSPKSGSVQLAAGLHPFRLYTIHGKKGKPSINLEWSGAGMSNKQLSASHFFRAK